MEEVFLITGGQGLLGSRLVPLLSGKFSRARLLLVTRTGSGPQKYHSNVQLIQGDLRDAGLWSNLPRDITRIFYLAAVIPWKSEEKKKASIAIDNLSPLAYLVESSQHWPDLKQIIYSSTVSVYAETNQFLKEDSRKNPADLYAASKLAGEQLLSCIQKRGVKLAVLRYGSLYAGGQYQGTVLPVMVRRALEKKTLPVHGEGKRTQDFIHCEDAAWANWLVCKKNARGAFNVGSGIPVSMLELAQTVNRVFAEGKAGISCLTEKGETDQGIKMDISKAKKELGFQPKFPLEKGLIKLKEEMEKSRT